jgi:hypothetical protein
MWPAPEDRWPTRWRVRHQHAEPVYRLFGKKGLGAEDLPPVNQPVGETIGYHIRTGKHDVTDYDRSDIWISPTGTCAAQRDVHYQVGFEAGRICPQSADRAMTKRRGGDTRALPILGEPQGCWIPKLSHAP